MPVPLGPTVAAADHCPPAIVDSDLQGTGLCIWVLVEETQDECVYEWAGGIV